jgi:hypothetical protein
MKRRILRKLSIKEISAVDRPCVEGATVSILKRAPETAFERRAQMLADTAELLDKFNQNHDPSNGRFAAGSGGAGGSSPTTATDVAVATPADGGTEVTQQHKDATLRWAQIALRTAKIASWALVAPAMIAAFTAAAPVGISFAITAALGTLVTRAALSRAAAFIAFDQALSALIRHREAELNKAAPQDDPILATLLALRAELRANKDKYTNGDEPMPDTSKADDAFEDLIAAEINASSMARHVAQQRILAKYGARPDADALAKARTASDRFHACVDQIAKRDGCSRSEALQRARREHADEFRKFQEAP